MSDDDTLTPPQAAKACRVSLRTFRRWLAAGELEGAYRDEDGYWHIPKTSILGRLPTGAPPEAEPARDDDDGMGSYVARLLSELEVERARRHAAEAIADAERARADAVERALEDVGLALRALAAGATDDDAEPTEGTPRRRRWGRARG